MERRHPVKRWVINFVVLIALVSSAARSDAAVETEEQARALLSRLAAALRGASLEDLKSIPILSKELAAIGESVLPVLEEELRIGIEFKDLNQLLAQGRSQRLAAAMVLAEMPGESSTRLLYRSSFDAPDNGGMHHTLLSALTNRSLDEAMVVGLLRHHDHEFVRLGISRARAMTNSPAVIERLKSLLDEEPLLAQFVNEYGKNISSESARFRVRREAGAALGRDMTQEVRGRARAILGSLADRTLQLGDPDQGAGLGGLLANTEWQILAGIDELEELGAPARGVVEESVLSATGDYANVLHVAAARLGNSDGVRRAISLLTDSPIPSIRICAASVLRKVRAPEAKAALWEAMRDPYFRRDRLRLRYPVQEIAAAALVEVGEDVVRVNAARTRAPNEPDNRRLLPPPQ